MKTILLLTAVLSVSVYFNFVGYTDLCTGQWGTQAFMTGDYKIIYQPCKLYDYSRFYPWFEKQTDSFRFFR